MRLAFREAGAELYINTAPGAICPYPGARGLAHAAVPGAAPARAADQCWRRTHQSTKRALFDELQVMGAQAQLVGGAYEATELDAKRAINQASRLAAQV